jgi:transposase
VVQDRKQETLDEFFRTPLSESQRKRIAAACVGMWRPFTNSIAQWAVNCRIVYDKFHVLQHANKAIDEVRRAEFFRKGFAVFDHFQCRSSANPRGRAGDDVRLVLGRIVHGNGIRHS